MKATKARSLKYVALALSALTPVPAFAQSAADDGPGAKEGEIIVTARKRSEDVQSVPISITAYTAESLVAKNISSFNDLGNSTPGLAVTTIAGGTTQQIFVRGLAPANTTTDLNVEANVGTFIDGIYQSSRNTLDMISVLDVGQIEIAKGPQSALFGRSTFAGALNIRTQRPTNELSGSVSATAGNDKDFRVKGSISLPISPQLAVRVAGGYVTYDGYATNTANPGNNLNGTKKYAVTASIRWKPSEDFTATLSGFVTRSESESYAVTLLPLASFNCGTTSATPASAGLRLLYCGDLTPNSAGNGSIIPPALA